jgi:hypothetical protein
MNNEEIQDREPTPEEIAEMRERMLEYYENQIPFLIKQKEYENLLSEIEIARARRIEASIRIAQMTMGPQDGQEEPEMVEEPKKRTLKKDK